MAGCASALSQEEAPQPQESKPAQEATRFCLICMLLGKDKTVNPAVAGLLVCHWCVMNGQGVTMLYIVVL